MKALFFNTVPYVASIFVGIIIFIVSDLYIEGTVNGLMINVASGLLSIPLIFIGYELVKSACTSRVNKTILEHINHEAKHCMISLLKEIHEFLPPEDDTLNDYLSMSKEEITNRLMLSKIDIPTLLSEKADIDRLVTGNKHIDLMPSDMLHSLLAVSKEISLLNLQMKNPTKHSERIVGSVAAILAAVLKWEDAAEDESAITGSHYLELI